MKDRSLFDVDYKRSSHRNTRRKNNSFTTAFLLVGGVMAMGAYAGKTFISQEPAIVAETSTENQVEIISLALGNQGQTETIALSETSKPVVNEKTATRVAFTEVSLQKKPDSEVEVKEELITAKQALSQHAQQELSRSNLEIAEATTNSSPKMEEITIKRGDSLSSLFSARGLNRELHDMMSLGKQAKELKSIYPGQTLRFIGDKENFVGIELETSVNRHLKITRSENTFSVEEVVRDFDTLIQVASSTIDSSLFLAGQRAGLSDSLIMELANIFGWDIDFALDIRTGDQFSVVYEEKYLDGEKVKDGTIIAAEFINDDHVYRAARYTDSKGNTDYYSPDGRSMRKPFLRTPVDFARISSGFNLRRKHPILNKIRAHRGVDYAASTGTPIKAAGDGRIVHHGNKGGYGRTIIIQHGSQYSTLYAHMDKYARGARAGARVKQGQIIGYVGKSGLATGPHLHYEFRVNGVHRNPLTVKLPDAQPLPSSEIARFKDATADQFARLDLYSPELVAQNKN